MSFLGAPYLNSTTVLFDSLKQLVMSNYAPLRKVLINALAWFHEKEDDHVIEDKRNGEGILSLEPEKAHICYYK